MTTAQQIAEHINQTKPDLKQFWADVESNHKQVYKQLLSEPFSYLNAFKLELIAIYANTHKRLYTGFIQESTNYLDYLTNANVETVLSKSPNAYHPLQGLGNYDITSTDSRLISTHVTDLRKYLNTYLKSKVTTPTSTAVNLKLDDNEFSLTIFTNWIESNKPINSVQAENFIKCVRGYTLYSKYLQLILDACPKPSIALQKQIQDGYIKIIGTTYSVVPRWRVRDNAELSFLAPYSFFENRDSDYTPFILGMYRKPTPTVNDVSALISIAAATKSSNPAYSKGIIEHLKLPEYATVTAEVKQNFLRHIDEYTNILGEF